MIAWRPLPALLQVAVYGDDADSIWVILGAVITCGLPMLVLAYKVSAYCSSLQKRCCLVLEVKTEGVDDFRGSGSPT